MENEDQEQDAGASGRPGARTWGLMALVAVVTVVAVWLVPVDDKKSTPTLPELPPVQGTTEHALPLPAPGTLGTAESGTDEEVAGLVAPASDSQESADAETASTTLDLPLPPGGVATVTNGGGGARAFLYKLRAAATGGDPDPEVVYAEAQRLQSAGELEDAYLLYRYAARHGHLRAAMTLGTAADPAYHSADNSYLPEPSPGQARKWYSLAAAAGDAEAGKRMDALHERLQREAAAGDEQAQRLLLQWR